MLNIVFSEDLDFLTKFQVVIVVVSFLILLLYLVVPMRCRRSLENFDHDSKGQAMVSLSGTVNLVTGALLAVFKLQKLSISKTA